MPKPTYIFLYYTEKPGGLCKRQYRLICALKNSAEQVRYLSLDAPSNLNIPWQKIPFPIARRSGWLFWLTFSAWACVYLLIFTMRHKQIKLIAFHPYYALLMFPTKLIKRCKLILCLRALASKTTGYSRFQIFLASRLEALAACCSDKIIAVNETIARSIKERVSASEKIQVISNDLAKTTGINEAEISEPLRAELEKLARLKAQDKFIFITLGVLDKRKNNPLVIEALHKLDSETRQRVRLLIVGDGPEANNLKQLSEELALSEQVMFLGWQNSVQKILAQCSCLIQASTHEGVSNSIMEALATNLPVLASKIEEHQELFSSDTNDNLFDLQASYLARLITLFVQDQNFHVKLNQISQETKLKHNFDWDQAMLQAICE